MTDHAESFKEQIEDVVNEYKSILNEITLVNTLDEVAEKFAYISGLKDGGKNKSETKRVLNRVEIETIESGIWNLLTDYHRYRDDVVKVLERITTNVKNGFTVTEMQEEKETPQERIERYTEAITRYKNLIDAEKICFEDMKCEAETKIETILEELSDKTGVDVKAICMEEGEDDFTVLIKFV